TRNVVVSDSSAVDQAERDRLPDWQHARGSYERPSARRALDWRICVALITGVFLIGGYIVLRVVQWIADTSYRTRWMDVYLIAALKIALFGAPVVFLGIVGYWLWGKARGASIVRLQNNMPIAARHIQRDEWQSAALASLDTFYQTEQV